MSPTLIRVFALLAGILLGTVCTLLATQSRQQDEIDFAALELAQPDQSPMAKPTW